jgi:transcriptional regulator with XRE-family HTH domain
MLVEIELLWLAFSLTFCSIAMGYYLDINELAALVRHKRLGRGLRETAKQIGSISISTISRVERKQIPDIVTFLALCDWLEVPPEKLIKSTNSRRELSSIDRIVIALQSDPDLDPEMVRALTFLVEAAFNYKR